MEEAALAWAQGKRVECLTVNQTEYLPVSRVGTSDGIISPTCFGERDEDRIRYKFRLAAEPPAKRYRPWTPEEVPVGAVMRLKTTPTRASLICSHGELCVFPAGATQGTSFQDALTHWLYSIDPVGTPDSKRTWLPCGVEVSE